VPADRLQAHRHLALLPTHLVSTYKSLPGRSMMLLIRVPPHRFIP
jgi:hypothetical protein